MTGTLRWVVSNCTDGAKWLAEDASLSEKARSALKSWLHTEERLIAPTKRLEAYLSGRDYEEDGFAGAKALAAELAPLLRNRSDMLRRVREWSFPELRTVMRDRQRAHLELHGQDDLWWRIELGLEIWDLNELSLEAGGVSAGQPWDVAASVEALREPMQKFREHATQAPIEVRRDVRKMDWISEPIAAGEVPRQDALWHLAHYDADLLRHLYSAPPPAYPPEPPPPPDNSGD